MSYSRKRFLSIWNGVATIIFFGGIFLGFSYLGYSGLMLGIFMWIIGGVIAGMIFGPSSRKTRRSRRSRKFDRSPNVPVEYSSKQNQFCIACGTEYPINDQFCPQCGTAGTNKIMSN